jgi:hypothetical protein
MIVLPHLGKECYPKSRLQKLVTSYWMNTTLTGSAIRMNYSTRINRQSKQS